MQEEFTENQKKTLEKFVSSTESDIFVLSNLPEVVKGALFSRYSRSSLGLRSLLLKEFLEDSNFLSITKDETLLQSEAIKKSQTFYDKILDGFGDDSIGELGGCHLAIENVSMLATKVIEDCRIGGSPLEKSTRYIYFDQKVNGEYLFYKEPVIMTSAYKELYLQTCNYLFDAYTSLIPLLTSVIEKNFPKDPTGSKVAYTAALRAKVLDCLRGLLPAGSLTNLGIFGNGRFFEYMLQKLSAHNLAEMQDISKNAFSELSKVIPSFVKRAEGSHKHHIAYLNFIEKVKEEIRTLTYENTTKLASDIDKGVYLINYDNDASIKVASALLFENSHASLSALQDYFRSMPKLELTAMFESISNPRENRRHKSPRALEQAQFTFEIISDFGIYRDLQRHRMLSQERQLLSCNLDFFIPDEILGTEMEDIYVEAMRKAKVAYDTIAKELPEEAQYVVPMAYNLHWYFTLNLRSLQWLCELRSSPQGHPTYRRVAQEMAKQVCKIFPEFTPFFKFVDYQGYELGRIDQENKKIERQKAFST
ncbi:MAG: FAD-dependent thymidylate synthase [Chlamydiae bacterium]|nr:FAD-dependent thymidylate synthase [Chlamydiota bacterium]